MIISVQGIAIASKQASRQEKEEKRKRIYTRYFIRDDDFNVMLLKWECGSSSTVHVSV